MRDFASDDLDDLRLLSLDELERVSGGDGEDGDEESPPPPPPVELPPIVVIADPPPPPVIIPPYTPPVDGGGGGGDGGDPEPNDPPEPPAHEERIDEAFIAQLEGGMWLDAYVVKNNDGTPRAESGVTVGVGVDLKSKTHEGLINLGLDESLVSMLDPYLGLKGDAALTAITNNPLHLSLEQATALTNAVWGGIITPLASNYDAAAPGLDFFQLPSGAQTVITSVALQFGPTGIMTGAPKFWGYVTSGNWQGAYNELMNFGPNEIERRHAEAARLLLDIQAGLLP
jgi:hypothetical protein